MTGSAPGRPRQTGQTWVFGAAPSYAVEQPQNIFDAVLSWAWTSIPMTGSYRSRTSERAAGAVMVAIAAVSHTASGPRPRRRFAQRADGATVPDSTSAGSMAAARRREPAR